MFTFGEKVSGYEGLVLNEREVRAAAGIVFLFAFIAFMQGFLTGNNEPTKLMVSIFLLDFVVRLVINPKYAPSMVLGRWMVDKQAPEYVSAAPKRWAWSLGLLLAISVFYLVVILEYRGPMNIIPCTLCLTLLFLESVFGICVGCKIYNWFYKKPAKYCPGDSCNINRMPASIQRLDGLQKSILLLSLLAFFYLSFADIISALITNFIM